ncbi:hypothetical protein MNB_SM-3-584 [hydrothermal vent metagenome]|uniref:TonB-dependent receptor plug domain-containing protein n=1 Tax=hydrothermal vent metagenome TaxID=652676 RepID=A0A1W1D239_9ZZZZ
MKLLFLLSFATLLLAKEMKLDHLLQKYESSQALYKKTKIESAGHLIIYSRRDLERMQAYRLKDVLKIIPLFTLQTSRTGQENIIKAGASPSSSTPIKLYIDDHEYPADLRQNIIFQYGNMNLYFVDHIEVYQGGTSIAFGNEIGSMIIRIYSKKSSRENATSIQTSGDIQGGYSLSALSAKETKYFDYVAFASHSNEKYETYKNKFNNTINEDGKQQQVHLKFYREKNWSLDIDLSKRTTNPFVGMGKKPLFGTNEQEYSFIGFTKYFPHNIKLILSSSKEYSSPNDYDDKSIKLSNGTIVSHIDMNLYNISNKIQLEKKFLFQSNELLLGTQLIDKHAHIGKYEADGVKQNIPDTPKKMDILMFYVEDSYNFNPNNLITLSAKFDKYNIEKRPNSNQQSYRLGYIGIYNDTMIKLFATRRYIAPRFNQTSFSLLYQPNPNLDVSKVKTITSEIQYKLDKKSQIDFSYGYFWSTDTLVFSQQQQKYINQNGTTYFSRYYIRYHYQFDYNNKFKLEYYASHRKVTASPAKGALIEFFNTIGKFDFYNQLAYRSTYTLLGVNVDASYEYTFASTYRYSRQLSIKLKGENLFNDAPKVPFVDEGILVQSIDRRVIATMEYTF